MSLDTAEVVSRLLRLLNDDREFVSRVLLSTRVGSFLEALVADGERARLRDGVRSCEAKTIRGIFEMDKGKDAKLDAPAPQT